MVDKETVEHLSTLCRNPPLPEVGRAYSTGLLIREGGTDKERWANLDNLATQWDKRAAHAAEHIPEGSTVLDIGAGAMALRGFLKMNCIYTPADVVSRSPDCLVVDMNANEFPDGHYDWVTFLGVLEYIHDISWALRRATEVASNMLFTYCVDTTDGKAIELRRGMGWVNDYNIIEAHEIIYDCGWRMLQQSIHKQGSHNHQIIFVCKRIMNP